MFVVQRVSEADMSWSWDERVGENKPSLTSIWYSTVDGTVPEYHSFIRIFLVSQ